MGEKNLLDHKSKDVILITDPKGLPNLGIHS